MKLKHTSYIMLSVILAATPAVVFMSVWQGMGFVINLIAAITSAVIFEALSLALRKQAVITTLKDYSAILTAMLMAIGIPGTAPFWVPIVGSFFAIVIAKQIYGGLGHSVFNPAMVGLAVCLVAFPAEMVSWPAFMIDGVTQATPLDKVFVEAGDCFGPTGLAMTSEVGLAMTSVCSSMLLSSLWLIGGLVLMALRVIRWPIPVAVITGVIVFSLVLGESVSSQLLLGATIVCAFFIATDPVTAPIKLPARLMYGFLIGMLIMLIRHFTQAPDGVAFAILLANGIAPLLDRMSP